MVGGLAFVEVDDVKFRCGMKSENGLSLLHCFNFGPKCVVSISDLFSLFLLIFVEYLFITFCFFRKIYL